MRIHWRGKLRGCKFIYRRLVSSIREDLRSSHGSSNVYTSQQSARTSQIRELRWRMAEWSRLLRNKTIPQSMLLNKGCGEME